MKTITATTMCFNACFRSGRRVKWNIRWKAVSFRLMQIHRICINHRNALWKSWWTGHLKYKKWYNKYSYTIAIITLTKMQEIIFSKLISNTGSDGVTVKRLTLIFLQGPGLVGRVHLQTNVHHFIMTIRTRMRSVECKLPPRHMEVGTVSLWAQ